MFDWAKKPVKELLRIRSHALHAYSVGLLQGKAYRTLERHLSQTLNWYDLSIHEWKLLGQLSEHASLSERELSKLIDKRVSDITKMGKVLRYKRLLSVFSSHGQKIYTITEQGRDLIQVVEISVKKSMKDLLAGSTRKELFIYLKVLMRIVDNG